jgi:hypothetical protein
LTLVPIASARRLAWSLLDRDPQSIGADLDVVDIEVEVDRLVDFCVGI